MTVNKNSDLSLKILEGFYNDDLNRTCFLRKTTRRFSNACAAILVIVEQINHDNTATIILSSQIAPRRKGHRPIVLETETVNHGRSKGNEKEIEGVDATT